MRRKHAWLVVRMVVLCLIIPVSGKSFHSGSTGSCQGCHTMHSSLEEQRIIQPNSPAVFAGTPYLLKGTDPSSTCLACHIAASKTAQATSYSVATSDGEMPSGSPPLQLTPGGDFGWLKKDYTWESGSGGMGRSPGERHGHGIVASDFGYVADARNIEAPLGLYPSEKFSCISCHDPHGRYRRFSDGTVNTTGLPVFASGSYNNSPEPDSNSAVGVYRLLAGKNYQPKYLQGGFTFTSDPPLAVTPISYNRQEGFNETRVAYGMGMSEWCQNCHFNMNKDSSTKTSHPAGNSRKLSSRIIENYNAYVWSGNLNGNAESAYTSLVSFEMGTGNYAVLKKTANSDGSDRKGPDPSKGSPNVMCLTCHRAHASAWDSMTRWNMKTTFLVYEGIYPGVDNNSPKEYAQGRTVAETQKAFYERPASQYASYQRNLCNKCHTKD